jgi:hypothetical protein
MTMATTFEEMQLVTALCAPSFDKWGYVHPDTVKKARTALRLITAELDKLDAAEAPQQPAAPTAPPARATVTSGAVMSSPVPPYQPPQQRSPAAPQVPPTPQGAGTPSTGA